MQNFRDILNREGVIFREGIKRAIELYVMRHGPGNYQTLLASYEPGGVRSEGQLEQEIIRHFQGLNRDIKRSELMFKIIKDLGYTRSRASKTADGLAKQLSDLGVKIWR